MGKIVICPGSFDPVTLGHLDIISRASKMFDKVIVAVSVNLAKTPAFTIEERISMLKRTTANLPNVEIDGLTGLLANYAKEKQATALVKGLRAVSDFEYEFQMALMNKKLNDNLETIFLTTSSEYMYLSSNIVRQVASLGGDISNFVPAVIHKEILEKLKKGEKNYET